MSHSTTKRLKIKGLKKTGYIILGLVVGVFSATLGSGGGSILVPGLTLIFGHKIKEIVSSSLATIVITSFSGALSHFILNPQNIRFEFWILVLAGSLIGARIGSLMTHRVRSWVLLYLSAAVMLVAALKLLNVNILNFGSGNLNLIFLPFLGLLSGFLSAFLGIGAGVILVPALNLVFGLSIHQSIPTALAVIAPTSLLGAWFHLQSGHLRTDLVKFLIPGTIVGAFCGAVINGMLSEQLLKYVLAIYILVSSIEMIAKADTKLKKGHLFLEP